MALLVKFLVTLYLRKKILNEVDKEQVKTGRARSVKFSECSDGEQCAVIVKENGLEGIVT